MNGGLDSQHGIIATEAFEMTFSSINTFMRMLVRAHNGWQSGWKKPNWRLGVLFKGKHSQVIRVWGIHMLMEGQ